jgi:diaminohydroxyphosphoribosylaminopyrimidine deaminase/5-amino-6-(5-phosphoribosylamino)uracil reductase
MGTTLETHQLYMQRALDLAMHGLGHVSPNPLVGCVIVHNDKVIGESFHQKYGEPHAEPNAIASVKDKSLLKESTLYVSLEPCCHYGKTPPCTDLLIHHKIPKVVVATTDPNPLVAGKGIAQLKNNGIEVIQNVLEEQAKEVNKRFFTNFTKKRPYIILKWAQSNDGHIAGNNGEPIQITSAFANTINHKWRTEEDAILVGYNTVQNDNPRLTARLWLGRNPKRIVIDPKNLLYSKKYNIFEDNAQVIVLNKYKTEVKGHIHWLKHENITHTLQTLLKMGIGSVIVEGGAKTLQFLINLNLWDEARVFYSKKIMIKNGLKAPKITESPSEVLTFENEYLMLYKNK